MDIITFAHYENNPSVQIIAERLTLASVVSPATLHCRGNDEGGGMTRRTVAEEGPDPIDVHVGGRLKQRRMILGLSQSDLGKSLNVTFQQVQKYERGANRLSASQLWRAADALKVDLTFFFSGLSEHSPISPKELTRHHAEMLRALELLSADTGRAFAALASAVVAERERDN